MGRGYNQAGGKARHKSRAGHLGRIDLEGLGLLPDGLGDLLDVQQLIALLGRGSLLDHIRGRELPLRL